MPIYRKTDGSVDYQDSTLLDTSKKTDLPTNPRRQTTGKSSPPASSENELIAPTIQPDRSKPPGESDNGARTRVFRPGKSLPEQPSQPAHPTQSNTMDDPPVGWLVVISGPGQGNFVVLGNGVNSIGRDASERLVLDFGDQHISRKSHAIITYDPRSKKFYLQQGGGINLIYVNDAPVLTPQELQPNTDIVLSATTLRFVPLCGESFDWDQVDS